jgi:macrodomain Ter protein organizer (MatP/YcbG family)
MGFDNIRMVLHVNGEEVTTRMVRKCYQDVENLKSHWKRMYALDKMKRPYEIFIEIRSNMEPAKRFDKSKKYIKHHESEK